MLKGMKGFTREVSELDQGFSISPPCSTSLSWQVLPNAEPSEAHTYRKMN